MFRAIAILSILLLFKFQLKADSEKDSLVAKFRIQQVEGSPEEVLEAYYRLGALFTATDMDSSWKYIQLHRGMAERMDSTREVVRNYRLESWVFRKEGNLEAALSALQEAWKLLQGKEEDILTRALLGDFAGIYYNAGFYQAAQKYLKEELKIIRRNPSIHNEHFGVLANLGFCTMELAEQVPSLMDTAKQYFEGALGLAIELGLEGNRNIAYDYLGELELQKEDGPAAESYFREELDSWRKLEPGKVHFETQLVFMGRAAYGLAKSYDMQGNADATLEYTQLARTYWDSLKRDLQHGKIAKLKLLESKVYISRNNLMLAGERVEEAIEMTKLLAEGSNVTAEIYLEAGGLKGELGAFKESNGYLRTYLDLMEEKRVESDQWGFFSNHSDLMNQILGLQLEQEQQASAQARRVRNLALGTSIVMLFLGLLILFLYRNLRKSHRLNQKYAEELLAVNQTRDKLISILGHDLRGPFQSILLMSEQTRQDLGQLEQGQVEASLKVIGESSREMYFLFENLLEWTRNESGDVPFQPEEIDLRKVLEETRGIIQSMAEAQGVSIRIRMDAYLVLGDPFMVRTILRNLIGNAIHHSTLGGQVEVWCREETEKRTVVSVIDQGVGMDNETLELLRQGIHETTGTHGLGLVLCRDFLETHESTLQIQSELGQGSQFSFGLETASPEAKLASDPIEDWGAAPKVPLGQVAISSEQRVELGEQFRNLKVYQTSRAHQLLAILEEDSVPSLIEWNRRFRNALSEFDEEEFHQLMNLLLPLASKAIYDPISK